MIWTALTQLISQCFMWFGPHFTRRLLLSSRVSLLVINLLTIPERVKVCVASPQTSFGVGLSLIHFSPTDVVRGGEMNAWQTNPKGRLRGGYGCTEAYGSPVGTLSDFLLIFHFFVFVFNFLLFTSPFCFSVEIFVLIFYFSVFAFNVLIFPTLWYLSVFLFFHFSLFISKSFLFLPGAHVLTYLFRFTFPSIDGLLLP